MKKKKYILIIKVEFKFLTSHLLYIAVNLIITTIYYLGLYIFRPNNIITFFGSIFRFDKPSKTAS